MLLLRNSKFLRPYILGILLLAKFSETTNQPTNQKQKKIPKFFVFTDSLLSILCVGRGVRGDSRPLGQMGFIKIHSILDDEARTFVLYLLSLSLLGISFCEVVRPSSQNNLQYQLEYHQLCFLAIVRTIANT